MKYKLFKIIIIISLINCSSKIEPVNNELNPYWNVVNLSLNLSNWGIMDMEFLSGDNGWAVGIEHVTSDEDQKGFILNYDGSRWSVVTLPEISSNWILWGIKIVSASDIWAVGADYHNNKEIYGKKLSRIKTRII